MLQPVLVWLGSPPLHQSHYHPMIHPTPQLAQHYNNPPPSRPMEPIPDSQVLVQPHANCVYYRRKTKTRMKLAVVAEDEAGQQHAGPSQAAERPDACRICFYIAWYSPVASCDCVQT